uniref:Uncharacterized protein n=1 Tax=Xiphophorus couchianus TaxID=32473 RepID=A0A3B5LCS7_9TELE
LPGKGEFFLSHVTTCLVSMRDQCKVNNSTQTIVLPPHPVTDAPHPVTDAPHPVTDAPHPVTDAPHPVTDAPHPVTDAPHPVTDAPHPVTDAPTTLQWKLISAACIWDLVLPACIQPS